MMDKDIVPNEAQHDQKGSLLLYLPWIFLAVLLVLGVILYFCGFRFSYNPNLENSWNAVSAVAAWASAIASIGAVAVAVIVALKQNKLASEQNRLATMQNTIAESQNTIAEQQSNIMARQNQIALFEKRMEIYQIVQEICDFEAVFSKELFNEQIKNDNVVYSNCIFASWIKFMRSRDHLFWNICFENNPKERTLQIETKNHENPYLSLYAYAITKKSISETSMFLLPDGLAQETRTMITIFFTQMQNVFDVSVWKHGKFELSAFETAMQKAQDYKKSHIERFIALLRL